MCMSHQSRYITNINLGKGCTGDSTSHFHQLASAIDWLLVSKTSYIHVGICQSSRIRNQGWRRVTPNLFVLRIDPSTTVDCRFSGSILEISAWNDADAMKFPETYGCRIVIEAKQKQDLRQMEMAPQHDPRPWRTAYSITTPFIRFPAIFGPPPYLGVQGNHNKWTI